MTQMVRNNNVAQQVLDAGVKVIKRSGASTPEQVSAYYNNNSKEVHKAMSAKCDELGVLHENLPVPADAYNAVLGSLQS